MKSPQQPDLNDVPRCLRVLADAIESDSNKQVSAVVLLRTTDDPELAVFGFGSGEEDSAEAFVECQIASAQLLEAMRTK